MSDDKPHNSNDESVKILDHNYDDIRELDHPLPRWWLGIFFLTIVFSVFYVGYYMLGSGPSSLQELRTSMSEIAARKPPETANTSPSAEVLLAAVKDPAKLKHGAEVFAGKCLACHGDKGQGLIGPNLTDDFWLHGKGTLLDVQTVVANGVPEKGMPPWAAILTPEEMIDVVAFVHSLHGTNPANAKAPQGEKQEFKD